MGNLANRIKRFWRPKDDESGGGGEQESPKSPPQPEQEGKPSQEGQGGEGGQGNSGKAGQPAKPAGSNPAVPSAKAPTSSTPVSLDQVKEAQQKQQKEQESEERLMERAKNLLKRNHEDELEDISKELNPSRRDKKQTDGEAIERKKQLEEYWQENRHGAWGLAPNYDHKTGELDVFVRDKDDRVISRKKIQLPKAKTPEQRVKNYLKALKQAEKIQQKACPGSAHNSLQERDFTPEELQDENHLERSLIKTTLNPNPVESVFDPATGESISKLNAAFSILAGKIAEDAVSWPIIGDDEWDIDAIMRRKYDKRPLSHCKQSRERSRLVLVLDTSPSCSRQAAFFSSIAQAALSFGDVEIYDAPNGRVEAKLYPKIGWKKVDIDTVDWGLANRHIVFFGDWDGADRIIYNSRNNKLYWFDCCIHHGVSKKERDEFVDNNFGFQYSDFKGKRYTCFNMKMFMRLVKKIK